MNQQIQGACQQQCLKAECIFATDKSYGIHPQEGIPQMYFDQLNIIAKHLQELKNKPTICQTQAQSIPYNRRRRRYILQTQATENTR